MAETLIHANIAAIHDRIASACITFGRDPLGVNLLAVSKTKPVSMIEAAYSAGQRHFGENYLNEAIPKIESLKRPELFWHYIGAIQSNKTRMIAEHFDYVHTIASDKIARRLSEARPDELHPLKVMVQVNISDEATKAGIKQEQALDVAGAILHYPRLELCGLMAIPAPSDNVEQQRREFARLRALGDEIRKQLGETAPQSIDSFKDLSMGMTNDLEAAVAEGATWLRIGTAIFGERDRT